jgi:hypothetical protein
MFWFFCPHFSHEFLSKIHFNCNICITQTAVCNCDIPVRQCSSGVCSYLYQLNDLSDGLPTNLALLFLSVSSQEDLTRGSQREPFLLKKKKNDLFFLDLSHLWWKLRLVYF